MKRLRPAVKARPGRTPRRRKAVRPKTAARPPRRHAAEGGRAASLGDALPVGLLFIAEGKIVWANPAALALFGVDLPALKRRRAEGLFPAALQGDDRKALTAWRRGQARGSLRLQYAHPRTGRRTYDVTLRRFTHHNLTGRLAVLRDITDQEEVSARLLRLEAQLRNSQERLRTLTEEITDGVALNVDGKIAWCNPAAAELTGYTRQELLGKPFGFLFAEKIRPVLQARRLARLEGKSAPDRYDATVQRKDGGHLLLDLCIKTVRVEGKKAVLVVARDATEQRLVERGLKLQRDLALSVAEETSVNAVCARVLETGMQVAEMDAGAIYLFRDNPGRFVAVEFRGFSERFRDRFWRVPGDGPVARRVLRREFVESTEPRFPSLTRRSMKEERLRFACWVPLHQEHRILGVLVLASREDHILTATNRHVLETLVSVACQAITTKRLEENLRQSEVHYRSLAENIRDGLTIVEHNDIVYANARACEIFGYPWEVYKNKKSWELAAPEEQTRLREFHERCLREGILPDELEYWAVRPDGRRVYVHNRYTYRGTTRYIVTTDMTARRQADEERARMSSQLQNAQRLESLGVLAGGIAHDFNNLLMGILGNTSLVLSTLPPPSPHRYNLEQIEKAATHAADLTRQLLAYAGKGPMPAETIHVNHLLRDVGTLLEVTVARNAEVHMELAPDLPAVEGAVTQLKQVVVNLSSNASEAMEGRRGNIWFRTHVRQAGRRDLETGYVDDKLPEGRYVVLEVEDDAGGISPEIQAKLFDPFFTTKFTGRGLGLAAVLGIVRAHRGAIRVASELGRGTRFEIWLPVQADGQPEAGATPKASARTPGGRILVVDDENSVRQVVRLMLDERGYQVVIAASGAEAVKRLQAEAKAYRAAVLDLTMPDMGGIATLKALRGIRPDLPVLMMSGYSNEEMASRLRGQQRCAGIQKPFSIAALTNALQSLLEGREEQD